MRAREAFEEFKKWCSQRGHDAGTETEFGKSLAKRFKKDRDKNGIYYKDAGLKTNRETTVLQMVKD